MCEAFFEMHKNIRWVNGWIGKWIDGKTCKKVNIAKY